MDGIVSGPRSQGRRRWTPALIAIAIAIAPVLASCVVTNGLVIRPTMDPRPSSPPPFRNGGYESSLKGVDGANASDVWAVGGTGWVLYPGIWDSVPFAAHWNGRTWSSPALPRSKPIGSLRGVAAVSPTDVWAVGANPNLLHYDGRTWRAVSLPGADSQLQLNSISAISARDIWAVGQIGLFAFSPAQPVSYHYNGVSWSKTSFPVAGGILRSVSTAGPNAVFAAGTSQPPPNSSYGKPFVARWTGTNWVLLPTPGTAGRSVVNAIGATNSTEAWAVGYEQRASDGFSLGAKAWHLIRGRWIQTMPDNRPGGVLTSIDARDASHIWAAGSAGRNPIGLQDRLFVARWTGSGWSTAFSFPTRDPVTFTVPVLMYGIRLIKGHVFSVGGGAHSFAVQN